MATSLSSSLTCLGRGFCRSKDAPPAAKPAIPLRTLRWTLGAKRACVVIKDIEPDRLAPLAPPAPLGLRGAWVVAARSCAEFGGVAAHCDIILTPVCAPGLLPCAARL